MTRRTLIISLALVASLTPTTAQAGHVLGPEAEGPVMAWLGKVGLPLDGVVIDRGVITAKGQGCTLTLSHPSAAACHSPRASGNAAICREGKRCPADRRLDKAGPLTLPWRAGARDAADAANSARATLLAARVEAQRRFDIDQLDVARDALLPLLGQPEHRPLDLLDALVTLTGLGGGQAVLEALNGDTLRALPVAFRASLRVAASMGPGLGAHALIASLSPDIACDATAFAAGLEVVHGHRHAVILTRAIRALAPGCVQAYTLEAEMLATLRDHAGAKTVIDAALARFPDHPSRPRLDELALSTAGDEDGLIALYERRLAEGDRSPGLFSVLFSHYVKHGVMADRVERYMGRAERDPNDDVAALVAGVLLHYDKHFARSNALVERAAPRFPEEPRVYIYQAMNHFNLGHRAKAEAFIAQAEALAAPDPDVYYCIGEIYRDTDRAKALGALEIYWHMTAVSGGDITEKQGRVRGMMDAIAECQRADTPPPCPGPFEHTFGSAAP